MVPVNHRGKNKMNNHKSERDNNKKEVPQICWKLDGNVINIPLSNFYSIIENEINNFIMSGQTRKNIISLNDLVNVQDWVTKFKKLENQARMLANNASRLKSDLKTNKFAQPVRCISASFNQHVIVTENIKGKMARDAASSVVKGSNKKYQIYTISDSEDEDVIITHISNIKSVQTNNDNITDLIDLDDDTQNLEVQYQPAPKSKINVSIPDLKTNDNNKALPNNTKAGKTLSNGEFLSTTIHKRKPGPKSKTMFVSDMVPFNTEKEETPAKKMRLNECEVINNKESNTINLLSFNSIKKLEVPEKYIRNLKSPSLKYPPPYPLIPPHNSRPSWKNVPPIPNMTIKVSGNKVTLTWDLNLNEQTAKIKMYELFVCQESDALPDISMWKKKRNIDACLLPMVCELEVVELGHIYYIALRAVDVHNRRAPCAVKKIKI